MWKIQADSIGQIFSLDGVENIKQHLKMEFIKVVNKLIF